MTQAFSNGPIIYRSLRPSSGTSSELHGWVVQNLLDVGWTTVSGSGTDVTMQTASTPQGLSARVRIRTVVVTPFGTTRHYVEFQPMASDGTGAASQNAGIEVSGSVATFDPKQFLWIMWANKFQFFVFNWVRLGGGAGADTDAFCMGVPHIPNPPLTVPSTAIWALGSEGANFYGVGGDGRGVPPLTPGGSSLGWRYANYGGTAFTAGNSAADDGQVFGSFGLAMTRAHPGYMLADGTGIVSVPLVAVSLATNTAPKIIGILWDALMFSQKVGLGQRFSFNNKQYISMRGHPQLEYPTLALLSEKESSFAPQ